jgi:predicted metal-dependent hydrolase
MNEAGTSHCEPAGLNIVPIEIVSALSADTPRYWFDRHPFKTHYFNALSTSFPVGERFFIRSVRYYEKQITDVRLREQILQFVGQEGHHRIEHTHHIDILLSQGYGGVRNFERVVQALLDFLNRRFPLYALAATVALEHFTAILADELLRRPDRWLAPMHPDMRLLWQWHAVEETEHKAVAFDVYRQAGGSYALRVSAMVLETIGFLLDILIRTAYFLWKDGKFWNIRIWLEGIRFVWGRHGALGSVVGAYFRFFRRDFHPWQHNNYHFVEAFLKEYGK